MKRRDLRGRFRELIQPGSISGNTLRIYALQAGTIGIGFIGSIAFARALGPSGKGVVDLFLLIPLTVAPLAFVGLPYGLLYELTNKGKPLNAVHGTGLVAAVAIGLFTAVLGLVGLPIWRDVLPGLPDWMIIAGFGLAPVTLYEVVWISLMIGINRAVESHALAFALSFVMAPVMVVLWQTGDLTATTAVIATLIATVGSVIPAFLLLRRHSGPLEVSLPLARDSFRFGLPVYVAMVASTLHFRLDQVMVNLFLGTSSLGVYTVAVNFGEAVFLLDTAIAAAALHRIASSDPDESYRLTRRLVGPQFAISALGGLAIVGGSTIAIPLLYGDRFSAAVIPMLVLMPGVVAWSTSKLVGNFLAYNRGFGRFLGWVSVAGLALNAALNGLFLGVMGLGITAASAASTISYGGVAAAVVIRAWTLRPRADFSEPPDIDPTQGEMQVSGPHLPY